MLPGSMEKYLGKGCVERDLPPDYPKLAPIALDLVSWRPGP